jgi:hypothetical protein
MACWPPLPLHPPTDGEEWGGSDCGIVAYTVSKMCVGQGASEGRECCLLCRSAFRLALLLRFPVGNACIPRLLVRTTFQTGQLTLRLLPAFTAAGAQHLQRNAAQTPPNDPLANCAPPPISPPRAEWRGRVQLWPTDPDQCKSFCVKMRGTADSVDVYGRTATC